MAKVADAPAVKAPVPAQARWLDLAGVLCVVLAFAPRFEHEAKNGVEMKTFSLGLPFSPLFARTERVTHSAQDGFASIETSQTGMEFGIPSWSLLSLILGAGLLAYTVALKRSARSAEVQRGAAELTAAPAACCAT